jgi:hypothetical protein
MKTVLHFLVLAFTLGSAWAQTAAGSAATLPITLPLQQVGNHLVVELDEQTLGKLRLLVDTGSERTLVSARLAAVVKVDHHLTDRFYRFNGFGSGAKAKLKGHAELKLRSAGRDLGKLNALVLDAAHIGIGTSPGLDGILGWDFFEHNCVRIDARGGHMVVSDMQHCAPVEEGFYAPPVDWMREGMMLPVTVTLAGNKMLKLNLHVDTGADNIVLSPRLRPELGLSDKPQPDVPASNPSTNSSSDSGQPQSSVHHGSGVNGTYTWDLVTATVIEVDGGHPKLEGSIPLVAMREGSYARPHWLTSGPAQVKMFRDGVIGNSVLSFYELVFDPVGKKLYERAYSFVPQTKKP